MIILGIETSCDDTAISLVEAVGSADAPEFKILSSVVSSQTALHAEWGGVVPMLAKREHERNLPLILIQALKEAELTSGKDSPLPDFASSEVSLRRDLSAQNFEIDKILVREPELLTGIQKYILNLPKPKIDAIAVTYGPGLEPALWSGINFARVLSLIWDIPVIPTNHMEGHVVSALLKAQTPDVKGSPTSGVGIRASSSRGRSSGEGGGGTSASIEFPILALLVSGGHTELALINSWTEYRTLAQTRDDAAGEAFDKVARILGLPYPGGPEIAKLALQGQPDQEVNLPRPMIHSKDLDFSFSGLKTAVLYLVKSLGGNASKLSEQKKANIAFDFQNAIADVLVKKVDKALTEYEAKSFIMGGGVTANTHIRAELTKLLENKYPHLKIYIPDKKYTTDNAAMIAGAAYFRIITGTVPRLTEARGNLKLA